VSAPPPAASFDPRPLIEPVDRTAARDFARRLRSEGRAPSLFAALTVVGVVVGAVVVLIVGGAFISVFVSILASVVASGLPEGWTGVLFFVIPVLLVGGVFALLIVGVVRSIARQNERWYRLDRFARANAMTYLPELADPPLPGMIFSIGSSRQAVDLVRGERPRFVEFANYRYTTGSGKDRTTHQWGYIAVKLDVPLPNIVLDATGNNSFFGSNLPASFDTHQRLSLEGDFDEHFALYCPQGYERDALYLFTPDVMARFIDHSAALDVEIVDDWLFLYAKRDFSTLDPATWAWLFSVVGALLDKLAQWARWRDERLQSEGAPWVTDAVAAASVVPSSARGEVAPTAFAAPATMLRPPPGVAPQGRRLTRRVSWVTIVAMVVVIGFWLLGQSRLLGLIFRS
jgi:hypothetical protein